MMNRLLVRLLAPSLLFVAGCTTPRDGAFALEGSIDSKVIQLDGWLDTHGELRLFVSEEAMEKKSEYPYCISGISWNHTAERYSKFNKRHIRVHATTWDFGSLPNESDYELARKVLGNSIITNWCYGPKVLLVSKIEALND